MLCIDLTHKHIEVVITLWVFAYREEFPFQCGYHLQQLPVILFKWVHLCCVCDTGIGGTKTVIFVPYRILSAEQISVDHFLHPTFAPSLLPVVLVSHCQCMQLASSLQTYQVYKCLLASVTTLEGEESSLVTNACCDICRLWRMSLSSSVLVWPNGSSVLLPLTLYRCVCVCVCVCVWFQNQCMCLHAMRLGCCEVSLLCGVCFLWCRPPFTSLTPPWSLTYCYTLPPLLEHLAQSLLHV